MGDSVKADGNMDRRTAVKAIASAASAPFLFAFGCTSSDVEDARLARQAVLAAGRPYVPEFFEDHEWRTVRILADIVIPADDRSGSATDAYVPEFIDIIMTDRGGGAANRMREGLAWLDRETDARFGRPFIECSDPQRREVLDDIAWPDRALPEHREGVQFFNGFRDLTAAGFFSSPIGLDDLEYTGNRFVTEWNGCPEPALVKLGVSYG